MSIWRRPGWTYALILVRHRDNIQIASLIVLTVSPLYPQCTPTVPPLYPHCTLAVPPLYPHCTTTVSPLYSQAVVIEVFSVILLVSVGYEFDLLLSDLTVWHLSSQLIVSDWIRMSNSNGRGSFIPRQSEDSYFSRKTSYFWSAIFINQSSDCSVINVYYLQQQTSFCYANVIHYIIFLFSDKSVINRFYFYTLHHLSLCYLVSFFYLLHYFYPPHCLLIGQLFCNLTFIHHLSVMF